jgi:hypothetical protein
LNIEKTTPRITDEYYNYEEVPTWALLKSI